jgi:hypothetical protein
MPYVAVSRSPIHVRHTGEGPVDRPASPTLA